MIGIRPLAPVQNSVSLKLMQVEFRGKGPVKLIKRVKIAHSFLQFVSNQFHVIILSLPMQFYKWLSNNFSKPTSKNGDIGHFNL